MKNQIDHPANSDYKEEVSTLQQRYVFMLMYQFML